APLASDGPAMPGEDYTALPREVRIPAGAKSTDLLVLARNDQLLEGPEIVRARLATPEPMPAGYILSFYAHEALAVIADDEAGAPEIRLDIVEPVEGGQFAPGSNIEISALGAWA